MNGYRPIHDEVAHAFRISNARTRTALAIVDEIYIHRHTDGKFYIQCRVDTQDGERGGYFKFGFSEKKHALDFANFCFRWLVSQN